MKLFSLLHLSQGTAVALSLFVVIFAVFAWAAFVRKPQEKHSRPHQHHWRRSKSTGAPEESGRRSRGIFARLRRRKHRRKERPRNPTLAETGGLPSARGGEPGASRPS